MLIDSHCHLDYEYELTTDEIIREARDNGIDTMIAIAAAPDSLEPVRLLAEKYDNIFHTSGIHPHDAKEMTDAVFAEVKAKAASDKCVAIGELGLDYHYDHSPHDVQKSVLQRQLDFAIECKKPVVVHTRDADDDTIDILTKHAKKWAAKHGSKSPGVIHCFTTHRRVAEAMLDCGFYISFSGIITFKSADSLRETVRDVVPMERLLVETDSPYLTPVPHRGKKNYPKFTKHVAEKVAELKGISFAEVERITRQNTIDLFELPVQ